MYGELLGAAHRLADQIGKIDDDTKRFLIACADTAAIRWREKDQGIWEVRGDPQHFLYSKVMCWVALDRAITLADLLGAGERVDRWKASRDEIWETVVRDGWSDEAGAFTQYVGSTALDASNLMMPIVGFLPAERPADARHDRRDRRAADRRARTGLPLPHTGGRGRPRWRGRNVPAMHLLARPGAGPVRSGRARPKPCSEAVAFVERRRTARRGDRPDTGELLGNFPQAFSHIGLVNAAWAIAEAPRRGTA